MAAVRSRAVSRGFCSEVAKVETEIIDEKTDKGSGSTAALYVTCEVCEATI